MKRAPSPQLGLDLRRRTRAGKVARPPGRKASKARQDPLHRTRPVVSPRQPQHVVLRVTREVGNLRRGHAYRAVRGALRLCAKRGDYRIVHVSIQSNHVHLIVEADDALALSRGMQGFAISAAKRLNRELRRKTGDVFAFRYHATAIETPTQARNTISYVLNNWRRHREDWRARGRIDPYSTAYAFAAWKQPPPPDPLPSIAPRTWLLVDGWKRTPRPPRYDETPSSIPTGAR